MVSKGSSQVLGNDTVGSAPYTAINKLVNIPRMYVSGCSREKRDHGLRLVAHAGATREIN